MSIILATQEAEIRRIVNQPEILSQKKTDTHTYTQRTGGVAQGVDPKFKP
jgi:hypothetical protein